jgi:hypothetical protein
MILKKDNPQITDKSIDLTRWRRFLAETDASLRSVLNNNHLDDIGAALVYTDN